VTHSEHFRFESIPSTKDDAIWIWARIDSQRVAVGFKVVFLTNITKRCKRFLGKKYREHAALKIST
jgi:hypothetical protein